jgi:hypothetical protein
MSAWTVIVKLLAFGSEGLHLHHDRHRDQEDDQQHQQDVDERRDVDLALDPARLVAD